MSYDGLSDDIFKGKSSIDCEWNIVVLNEVCIVVALLTLLELKCEIVTCLMLIKLVKYCELFK